MSIIWAFSSGIFWTSATPLTKAGYDTGMQLNITHSLTIYSHMFSNLYIHVFGLKVYLRQWRIQGAPPAPPPPNRIHFFHFCICFCQKVYALEVGASPNGSASPPNGKSWIRHCEILFIVKRTDNLAIWNKVMTKALKGLYFCIFEKPEQRQGH